MTLRTVWPGVAACSVLLGFAATGCGSGSSHAARPATSVADGPIERPYVLVSGRDDHGLVEVASVPVLSAPVTGGTVGYIADGTLARVLEARGTWLRVAPVRGASPPGWVDDYRLRGVVHLVGRAPSCRVSLGGRRLAAGEQATVTGVSASGSVVSVSVRLVRRPSVTGTVPLRYVRELPPSPDDPCPKH